MTQVAQPAPAPLALPQQRKLMIYIGVLAGMFMATLDMQIIATALPTITEHLGNPELFGWVGAAYLLATAAVTPFYGKLGDMFGRKRVFMFAIILFMAGSLACGLAWSMQSLIAARVLQGLGGGGLMTSAFAIIADLFEPRERAKYQGYSSAVFTLSGLIGPVAGGIISDTVGWPFIFLVNVPVGLVVIAILAAFMPKPGPGQRRKVDYLGGLLLAAAVTLVVFWAEQVLGGGQSGPMSYVLPLLAVAAAVAFVLTEQRAAEPVVPLHLLRNPTIVIVLSVSVLVGIVTLGMLNYFALFLQVVTGLPPALAGLLFLPASVGSLIASIGSGMLISRTGRYKIFPVMAMALGVVVMLAFTLVDGSTLLVLIGGLMFFFSVSMGLQMQTLMVAVQAAAPRQDVGAATGLIALVRMIGASLGLAANGGLLMAGLSRGQEALDPAIASQLPGKVADLSPGVIDALPDTLRQAAVAVFSGAFDTVFLFGAGVFAAGFVLTLFLKNVQLPTHAKAVTAPVAE